MKLAEKIKRFKWYYGYRRWDKVFDIVPDNNSLDIEFYIEKIEKLTGGSRYYTMMDHLTLFGCKRYMRRLNYYVPNFNTRYGYIDTNFELKDSARIEAVEYFLSGKEVFALGRFRIDLWNKQRILLYDVFETLPNRKECVEFAKKVAYDVMSNDWFEEAYGDKDLKKNKFYTKKGKKYTWFKDVARTVTLTILRILLYIPIMIVEIIAEIVR